MINKVKFILGKILKFKYVKSFNHYCYIILSLFRPVSFIIFSIFLFLFQVSAQDTNDSSITATKQTFFSQDPIRFAIHLSSSYRKPIEHAGIFWQPYPTVGIGMDFPTYIPKMLVRITAEAGQIKKSDQTKTNIGIIHASVSVSYDFPGFKENIIIRRRIGLSDAMVSFDSGFNLSDLDKKIFNNVENEFGFLIGVEPILKIKRFRFTIPITADIIFSSPNKFITVNISTTAGVTF